MNRSYKIYPSRAAINAALLLQSPLNTENKTMAKGTAKQAEEQQAQPSNVQIGTQAGKGVRMSQVQTGRDDMPLFIKAEELSQHPVFTIFGARKRFNPRFGGREEACFDVAIKMDDGSVERRTVTFLYNDDRARLIDSVKQNKFITNCRLDRIQIEGSNNGYWKFVDAETPRSEEPPTVQQSAINDDDIPF